MHLWISTLAYLGLVLETYTAMRFWNSGHIAATTTSFRLRQMSMIFRNATLDQLTFHIGNAYHKSLLEALKLQLQTCRGRQHSSEGRIEALQ